MKNHTFSSKPAPGLPWPPKPPETSQMPPRCLQETSQIPPDASLRIPPERLSGCASRGRNPSRPQITQICHQMGRHPTVFYLETGPGHRISARISPWGSRPLNLNFFFDFFWTRNRLLSPKTHFWGEKNAPARNARPVTGVWELKNRLLSPKTRFLAEKNAPARNARPVTGVWHAPRPRIWPQNPLLGAQGAQGGPRGPKGAQGAQEAQGALYFPIALRGAAGCA